MTETLMCAFPPLGKPVQTVLTDRTYLVLNNGQMAPYEFDTLPAAWDKAREMAEATPDNLPAIFADFGPTDDPECWRHIKVADWRNTY